MLNGGSLLTDILLFDTTVCLIGALNSGSSYFHLAYEVKDRKTDKCKMLILYHKSKFSTCGTELYTFAGCMSVEHLYDLVVVASPKSHTHIVELLVS
jgi:hypothetical protein